MSVRVKVTVDDYELRWYIKATKGKAVTRIVADGVNYGIYQEMGYTHTSGKQVAGKAFMRPAVEKVRRSFTKGFKNSITLAQVEFAVEKAARDVERFAKILAPVDTGALRNSIHVVESGSGMHTYTVKGK